MALVIHTLSRLREISLSLNVELLPVASSDFLPKECEGCHVKLALSIETEPSEIDNITCCSCINGLSDINFDELTEYWLIVHG